MGHIAMLRMQNFLIAKDCTCAARVCADAATHRACDNTCAAVGWLQLKRAERSHTGSILCGVNCSFVDGCDLPTQVVHAHCSGSHTRSSIAVLQADWGPGINHCQSRRRAVRCLNILTNAGAGMAYAALVVQQKYSDPRMGAGLLGRSQTRPGITAASSGWANVMQQSCMQTAVQWTATCIYEAIVLRRWACHEGGSGEGVGYWGAPPESPRCSRGRPILQR